MVKKGLAVFAVLVVFSAGARAQSIGAYGSYIFVDELDDVYGAGVQAQFPLSDVFFASVRGGYYPEVEREQTVAPVFIEIEADYYPLDIGLGAQKAVDDLWTVYADAGLSYIYIDSEIKVNGMMTPIELENEWGWFGALGVTVGHGVQGFCEAQYRTFTWSVDKSTLPPGTPSVNEIELDHIAVNAGIRFQW